MSDFKILQGQCKGKKFTFQHFEIPSQRLPLFLNFNIHNETSHDIRSEAKTNIIIYRKSSYIKLIWYFKEKRHWRSLSKSLHLILIIQSLHEKGRSILSSSLMFIRILAERKNDSINRHLHHTKEESGNYVSKNPTYLYKDDIHFILAVLWYRKYNYVIKH